MYKIIATTCIIMASVCYGETTNLESRVAACEKRISELEARFNNLREVKNQKRWSKEEQAKRLQQIREQNKQKLIADEQRLAKAAVTIDPAINNFLNTHLGFTLGNNFTCTNSNKKITHLYGPRTPKVEFGDGSFRFNHLQLEVIVERANLKKPYKHFDKANVLVYSNIVVAVEFVAYISNDYSSESRQKQMEKEYANFCKSINYAHKKEASVVNRLNQVTPTFSIKDLTSENNIECLRSNTWCYQFLIMNNKIFDEYAIDPNSQGKILEDL